jgi:hypothetical protein
MDVCVVLDVRTIARNIRRHAGQKGLQQYKWIKGENPGINPGHRGFSHLCTPLPDECYDTPPPLKYVTTFPDRHPVLHHSPTSPRRPVSAHRTPRRPRTVLLHRTERV